MKRPPVHGRLSKRTIYLFILSLLFVSVIFATFHILLYGGVVLSGTDTMRHFDRANAIRDGRVDIFHVWDNPEVVEFYPPGFHILIVLTCEITGISNPFVIQLILLISFTVITSLLYFIIGAKISPGVGLLAILASNTIPSFLVNYQADYIFFQTSATYLNTTAISVVMFLLSLIAFLTIVLSQKITFPFFLIFYLSMTVHGLSHISTYIATFFGFILLIILSMIFRNYYANLQKISYPFFSLLGVLLLSGASVFFIYYFPHFNDLTSSSYEISSLLPPIIRDLPLIYIPLIAGGTAILGMILMFIPRVFSSLNIRSLRISSLIGTLRAFLRRYSPFIFLLILSLLILLVNTNLGLIPKGSAGEVAHFPTYYPRGSGIFGIVIYSIGVLFIGFAVLGLFGLNQRVAAPATIIAISFFLMFMMFIVFYVVVPYYSHRMMRPFEFMLPLILGGIIHFNYQEYLPFKKIPWKKIVVFSVAMSLISITTVSEINKDPAVCDETIKKDLPLRLGKSVQPPLVTPQFIAAVHAYAAGEVILATPQITQVLGMASDIDGAGITYVTYYKDHNLWSIYVQALNNPGKTNEFFRKNGGELVITTQTSKELGFDPSKFENSLQHYEIYENGSGERIFVFFY